MTPRGFPSPLLPTIGALVVILVNAWIVWFILFGIPLNCARLAAETGGRETCGLEIGAYVIVGISAVLILVGVYYILKWHVKRTL